IGRDCFISELLHIAQTIHCVEEKVLEIFTWEGKYQLNEQSTTNKNAWEYRAYEFWNKRDGSPMEKAQEILKDPKAKLKKHQDYFEDVKRSEEHTSELQSRFDLV